MKEIREWAVTGFSDFDERAFAVGTFSCWLKASYTTPIFSVCLLSLSGKHALFCPLTRCREGEARLSQKGVFVVVLCFIG